LKYQQNTLSFLFNENKKQAKTAVPNNSYKNACDVVSKYVELCKQLGYPRGLNLIGSVAVFALILGFVALVIAIF